MKIVTGMHRSGTSFLAQALSRLGAGFGPPELLFPADAWNQNGYFENVEIVDINNQLVLGRGAPIDLWLEAPEHGLDRLLNSLRSRKWRYFLKPSPRSIRRRADGFAGRIAQLHETYAGTYVKDPRFCLTLGAWAARGPIEDVVFSFRDPLSVALSVRRREKLPLAFGFGQWLYHVRGFWSQVGPGTPVFLVEFDRFFEAEGQAAAFDRLIRRQGPGAPEALRAALVRELDPRLRHHGSEGGAPKPMPRDVAAAHGALRALYAACGPEGVLAGDHPAEIRAILGGRGAA